jgi:hypothetical protein
MKAKVFVAAALLSVAVLGITPVAAQTSLGDAAADEAVAALQERAGDAVALECTFLGGWVTCSGAKIGVCLSAGWLVNNSGASCRKKVS